MITQALFLSLRPVYADLLMSGEKTVELRRIRPKAAPGTLVIIYASSPQREIVGTCVVEDVGEAAPSEIWKLHGDKTAISKSTFMDYFSNAMRAVAITIRKPKRLQRPIPLTELRSHWVGFQPPQTFRYIDIDEANTLLDQAKTKVAPRSA